MPESIPLKPHGRSLMVVIIIPFAKPHGRSLMVVSVAGTTMEEMQNLLNPVLQECCDEPGEDCSGGYPSVCSPRPAPSPHRPPWPRRPEARSMSTWRKADSLLWGLTCLWCFTPRS